MIEEDQPPGGETLRVELPHGFRRWILSNAAFIRALLLVSVYVSGALCLISIFLFGGFRLAPKILAAICAVALALVLASLGFKPPR